MAQQATENKAQELFQEYKKSWNLNGYSNRRRQGYITRVKNVAKKVSLDSEDTLTIMRLTHLETRLGIELEWL